MGSGLGFVLLDGIEVARFQAQAAAHGIKHGSRQGGALLWADAGQHRRRGKHRGLGRKFVQPAVGDGQQVELVEVGVVEAPAAPQITQEPVANDEAHGALRVLPGKAHQFGGSQIFRQGGEVGLVKTQGLEDGVGQGFLGQHALVVLQRAHQGRAQGEQKDKVVEMPRLQGGVLAVVGEAQQLARIRQAGRQVLRRKQLPNGTECEDGGS